MMYLLVHAIEEQQKYARTTKYRIQEKLAR